MWSRVKASDPRLITSKPVAAGKTLSSSFLDYSDSMGTGIALSCNGDLEFFEVTHGGGSAWPPKLKYEIEVYSFILCRLETVAERVWNGPKIRKRRECLQMGTSRPPSVSLFLYFEFVRDSQD